MNYGSVRGDDFRDTLEKEFDPDINLATLT